MRRPVVKALAAAVSGIAVVFDEPHFGLHEIQVAASSYPLQITYYAEWVPRHHTSELLASMAEHLEAFCEQLYGPQV